eukprot:3599684-Alexandrium_andersonii.AAC.1
MPKTALRLCCCASWAARDAGCSRGRTRARADGCRPARTDTRASRHVSNPHPHQAGLGES